MTILGPFPRIHVTWSGNLTAADCIALDERAKQMVNGDDGGCWAPATSLEFSGMTFGLYVTAPILVWGAGYVQTYPGSGSRFSCDNGTFPVFGPTHSGRTRTLMSTFIVAACTPWLGLQPQVTSGGLMTGGMQTVAGAFQFEDGSVQQTTILAELAVHNGGTLSQVVLSFSVPAGSAAPSTPPRARIVQMDVYGNLTPCTSAAAGGDVAGYVTFPAPSGATGWYNGGAAQVWTIACDQNNIVDISQFCYLVEIIDAQGTTATPLVLTFVDSALITQTSGAQHSLSGGGNRFAGDRTLVVSQFDAASDPALLGVWQSHVSATGPWIRPPDFANGLAVAAGTIIPVHDSASGYGPSLWALEADIAAVLEAPSWQVSTPYGVGAIVSITDPNGVNFQCVTAGTSGGSDVTNTWTLTPGATQTDNTVTWKAIPYVSSNAVVLGPVQPRGTVWIAAETTMIDIPGLAFQ